MFGSCFALFQPLLSKFRVVICEFINYQLSGNNRWCQLMYIVFEWKCNFKNFRVVIYVTSSWFVVQCCLIQIVFLPAVSGFVSELFVYDCWCQPTCMIVWFYIILYCILSITFPCSRMSRTWRVAMSISALGEKLINCFQKRKISKKKEKEKYSHSLLFS